MIHEAEGFDMIWNCFNGFKNPQSSQILSRILESQEYQGIQISQYIPSDYSGMAAVAYLSQY